jgi:hypothetical protein
VGWPGTSILVVLPRSAVTVQVEPDYFQFYARREGAEWASGQTTDAGYEEHLWSNGDFVYIGTARKYGTTTVVVEVWDTPPLTSLEVVGIRGGLPGWKSP